MKFDGKIQIHCKSKTFRILHAKKLWFLKFLQVIDDYIAYIVETRCSNMMSVECGQTDTECSI